MWRRAQEEKGLLCAPDISNVEIAWSMGSCSTAILQMWGEQGVCYFLLVGARESLINSDISDGNGKVPLIIPFPPPPPGFSFPPEGVPNPHDQDSCPEDFTDTWCKDCKDKSGWCTEGPRAGCPCRDECPDDDSDDVPQCKNEICLGEDGKCTTVSSSGYVAWGSHD